MRSDLISLLKRVDRRGWKKVKVEFTGGPLSISVPPDCLELSMKKAEILRAPRQEIERALDNPIGGLTLEKISARNLLSSRQIVFRRGASIKRIDRRIE